MGGLQLAKGHGKLGLNTTGWSWYGLSMINEFLQISCCANGGHKSAWS